MEDKYIIGMDLNEYEGQICRYDKASDDMSSVMVTAGGSRSTFPAKLAYLFEEDKWKYGIEADFFIAHKGAVEVDNVYLIASNDEDVVINDRTFKAYEILATFIKEALTLASITKPAEEIETLAISIPKISKGFASNFEKAVELLNLEKKQAVILDHTESFYYHTFFQKFDANNKDTAIFDFPDDSSVIFTSIGANHGTKPVTVYLKRKEKTELPLDEKERDDCFKQFVKEIMGTDEYSAVFLVGNGFDRKWAKESLALLCRGQRKVFYGNNLFSKGAGYCALEKSGYGRLKDHLYVGNDLVKENIGMEMIINGESGYKPILNAGVHWYEAENEIEFLLNDAEDIVFRTSSMMDGTRKKIKMTLPNLPKRPPKTTRIRLNVKYEEAGKCVIRATDLGFGEIFKSSGLTWVETIDC